MNKDYVVGYLSLFDGELKQELVYARSPYEAARSYLGLSHNDLADQTMEAIHDFVTNCDAFINVIEVKLPRSGRSGTDLQNQAAELDSQSAVH